MANIIEINDLSTPGVEMFARLTEAQLRNRLEPEKGIFIAETTKVVRTALDAGYEPIAMLAERKNIKGLACELMERCGDIPLFTALLLAFSYYAKPRQKENISGLHAFVIGIAQAVAVLPGLSRSGSTIATGLLLGNRKEKLAQFSFLMVIPPILGEALLDVKDLIGTASQGVEGTQTGLAVLAVGFFAAFLSGCAACKWMISIVRKGKLIYFGIYCAIAGILTLLFL